MPYVVIPMPRLATGSEAQTGARMAIRRTPRGDSETRVSLELRKILK